MGQPAALAATVVREIVAGRHWRNQVVLGMLAVLGFGNPVFHLEAARGVDAAQGCGLRLGLAAGLKMIALIGGRIVPPFTRTWIVRRNLGGRPASLFNASTRWRSSRFSCLSRCPSGSSVSAHCREPVRPSVQHPAIPYSDGGLVGPQFRSASRQYFVPAAVAETFQPRFVRKKMARPFVNPVTTASAFS